MNTRDLNALRRRVALGDPAALKALHRELARRGLPNPSDWDKTFSGKLPSVPRFIDTTALPRLRFKDGTPLSADGIRWLLGALRTRESEDELEALRDQLDEADCGKFGAALRAQWEVKQSKSHRGWIFETQYELIDEKGLKALAKSIPSLSRVYQIHAIEILGHHATPVATGALVDRYWGGVPTVKQRASEMLDEVAKRTQLSLEVILDAHIPRKPNAHRQRIECARLESAMVTGRTWTPEDFARLFIEHPYVKRWGQTLLFAANPGNDPLYFTLDDAGQPSTPWPEGAVLSIPHPLSLSAHALETWKPRLSERKPPPFEQLHRKVIAPSDALTLKAVMERGIVLDVLGVGDLPLPITIGTDHCCQDEDYFSAELRWGEYTLSMDFHGPGGDLALDRCAPIGKIARLALLKGEASRRSKLKSLPRTLYSEMARALEMIEGCTHTA